jgi:hypothetical protein
MTRNTLERWIETAEARRMCEDATFDRMPKARRPTRRIATTVERVSALIADLFPVAHPARLAVPVLAQVQRQPRSRHAIWD